MAARPQWRNTVGPKSHPDRPVYFKEFHTSEKDVNDKDFAEVGHKVLQHHVLHEKKASEYFGVMANEDMPWDGHSDFVWRPSFAELCGKKLVQKMVAAITHQIDLHYPEQAPWRCLDWEIVNGFLTTRLFLQVNFSDGRQPFHFDAGIGYYKDESGKYLSTVTNMNDGVATFFKKDPLFDKFDRVKKVYKETGNAVLATKIPAVRCVFTAWPVLRSRP